MGAHVQTFRLPHYADCPVHVAVFQNVANAPFLRSQLLDANAAFDYAFLDASMIVSPQHLLSACFSAIHHARTNTLKARTAHSELVFRLHPNNNIGESYRKFGITDTTSALIAVKLALSPETTAQSVAEHLGQAVEGESVDIGEGGHRLGEWADVDKVRKVYKLESNGAAKKKAATENATEADEKTRLEGVILGIMTVKGS